MDEHLEIRTSVVHSLAIAIGLDYGGTEHPWFDHDGLFLCLSLSGCSRLTDHCLVYLQRLSCLSVLDLRGCKGISRQACEKFISELSVNALYCLSDDKLIQRIS